MKDILEYVRGDLAGHIERSGAPLRKHADPASDLTEEQRAEYFYGMTTVFPLMFLGHYYDWLDLPGRKEFQTEFFQPGEALFAPVNRALLDGMVQSGSDAVWLASVSSYLAYYPYDLLRAFGCWALPAQTADRVQTFIREDRKNTLPALAQRLSACCGDPAARIETVYWLGTEFPYELLTRFHRELFDR